MRAFSAIAMALAASAAALVSPVTHAGAIPPPPPHDHSVALISDPFGACSLLVNPPEVAPVGVQVTYQNDYGADATVTEDDGFWSFPVADGAQVVRRASDAGTFSENCGGYSSALRVRVKAPKSTVDPSFLVRWAASGSEFAVTHDVQFRVGGGSAQTWFTATTMRRATFKGTAGQTYGFRSRAIIGAGHRSGWSPWRTVVVVAGASLS